MRPLKVLIFDDDQDELDAMDVAFKKLFSFAEIDVEVECHCFTVEEIKKVLEFEKARPDIVILDNQFGRDLVAGKSMGQELIARMKVNLPDTLFLLMTKEEFREGSFGTWYPHPDVLVSKPHLENIDSEYYEEYKIWLSNEISYRLGRALIGEFDLGDAESELRALQSRPPKGRRRRISSHEIYSLIEQVCHTGGPVKDNDIDGVKLKLLQGGKSDAVVCLIFVRNKFGEYRVPAVIKIMDRFSSRRESHNHSKFVKWTLPYRWRVDIIGRGRTDQFGAVCYSFAHGGSGEPLTLADIIEQGDAATTSDVMASVFAKESNCWYANQRSKGEALGVYLSKRAPYFLKPTDWTKREQSLLDGLETIRNEAGVNVIQTDRSTIVQVGDITIDVTSPAKLVSSLRSVADTVECLSHGDLNAGNVLVVEGTTEFCFIDFQHTGWHHRARDFCSIEGSIRTLQREPKSMKFSERVSKERDAWERAASRNFETDGGANLIDEVRFHFFENHSTATALEFATANLVHSWWLLSFSSWNDYQRKRLLAFFLGTLGWIQTEIDA